MIPVARQMRTVQRNGVLAAYATTRDKRSSCRVWIELRAAVVMWVFGIE